MAFVLLAVTLKRVFALSLAQFIQCYVVLLLILYILLDRGFI